MKRRQFFSILGLSAAVRPQEMVDVSTLQIVAPDDLKALAREVAPIIIDRLQKNSGGDLRKLRRALGLPQ